MAPQKDHSDSSDDEAPETFSFGASKKAVQGAQDALQQFHAAQKSKDKQKNQERDRILKERAEQARLNAARKGKGRAQPIANSAKRSTGSEINGEEKGGSGQDDLETRMERAMREAEEESDMEAGGSFVGGGSSGASQSNSGSDEESEDEDDDGDMDGSGMSGEEEETSFSEHSSDADENGEDEDDDDEEDDGRPPRNTTTTKAGYLPDHLFQSALSKASASSSSSKRKLDASEGVQKKPSKKRKRPTKDIVVGSRMIRTLARPSPAVPSATPRALLPPAGVNRFLRRALNLKNSTSERRMKSWDRKAANIGIMKRNGPAASFVRNA